MSDALNPPTDTAPVKPPDAPQDVTPAVDHTAAANQAAGKGLTEVQNSISGPPVAPKPGDAAPTTSDQGGLLGDLESGYDGLANFASTAWSSADNLAASAWKKTDNAFDSWTASADDPLSKQFLDIPDAAFTSSADQTTAKTAVADSGTAAKTGSPEAGGATPTDGSAQIAVNDGQISVNNKELVASRDANGVDTVNEKGSNQKYQRAADGSVSEIGDDHTTKIKNGQVDTHVAGMHIIRATNGDTPSSPDDLQPNEARTSKHSIQYRTESFSDDKGGGTAVIGDNGTMTLENKDHAKLLLNSQNHEVEYTPPGGQPEKMTLDQFVQMYGKSEFGGFQFDGNAKVHTRDGAVLEAQQPGADGTPGKAVLTKVDNGSGDQVKTTVAGGDATVVNTDPKGKILSESVVNTNDPEHAYQQLDPKGNVLANYNLADNTFSGNGFAFNGDGMQISDGSVFVANDGSFSDSSSDYLSTDNSLNNFYTGDGSLYAAYTTDGSVATGLSTDDQADVASQMQTIVSDPTDVSAIDNVLALTNGKAVGLEDLKYYAEAKEDRAEHRDERRAEKDKEKDSNPNILDFGASPDPYGFSAA